MAFGDMNTPKECEMMRIGDDPVQEGLARESNSAGKTRTILSFDVSKRNKSIGNWWMMIWLRF